MMLLRNNLSLAMFMTAAAAAATWPSTTTMTAMASSVRGAAGGGATGGGVGDGGESMVLDPTNNISSNNNNNDDVTYNVNNEHGHDGRVLQSCVCGGTRTGTPVPANANMQDLVTQYLVDREQSTPAITYGSVINCWDVSQVTSMNKAFMQKGDFNDRLDCWDVSSVTDMAYMFYLATSFNQPLNSWDVSKVTNMYSMFSAVNTFNQPLNSWDVSSVKSMIGMFDGAIAFNQPLDSWDVLSVIDMGGMFANTVDFNQPLNSWVVSSVTTMKWMFWGARGFNQPLDSWDVSSVQDMEKMFTDAGQFNQDLCSWDGKVGSSTKTVHMFQNSACSDKNYPVLDDPAPDNWCQKCPEPSESPSQAPSQAPSENDGGGDGGDGGAQGDPHIKTWMGPSFDFMGECDLVLTRSEAFADLMGLEIQIRTTIQSVWSFISALALRIGDDILEVQSDGTHYFNGIKGTDLLMATHLMGGEFPVRWTMEYLNQHKAQKFSINLGTKGLIEVKVYNGFIDVNVHDARAQDFADSVGLMGSFRDGRWIARDGSTVLTDPDLFGQEWQVMDSDTMLFVDEGTGPQYPTPCKMPPKTQSLEARRLAGDPEFVAKAERACGKASKSVAKNVDVDACLFDVLATGDLNMAKFHSF